MPPYPKKKEKSRSRINAPVCSWSSWDLIHLNNEWKSETDCHRLGPPQSHLHLFPPLSLSPSLSLSLYHLFIFWPFPLPNSFFSMLFLPFSSLLWVFLSNLTISLSLSSYLFLSLYICIYDFFLTFIFLFYSGLMVKKKKARIEWSIWLKVCGQPRGYTGSFDHLHPLPLATV